MNSLQLLVAIKPTFALKRYAFTQKDRIKLLNSQNKSLYGHVIKAKPSKQPKPTTNLSNDHEITIPSSSDGSSTANKRETNYDSEMYWTIGNRLKEIDDESVPRTVVGAVKDKNKKSQESGIKLENNSEFNRTEQSMNVTETKIIDARTKEPTTAIQQPIPLSNEELKSVIRHPLHSDVLSSVANVDMRAPELRSIPSVGRVLQHTMSESARNALLNWKLAKISELGQQGFADLQQSHLNTGKTFHSSLQQYFLANEVPASSSPVYKLWESVRGVLDTFSAVPESVEQTVFHPTLKYKGICDCVAEVDNQLTIIEWKKSERTKPTLDATYDAPLQMCAYLGAMNSMPQFHGRNRHGMVVVAYENGKPADVYKMNEVMLRRYWRAWLGRLHEFWVRTRDGTMLEPI